MITALKEIEKSVREKLGESFSLSEFYVESVRQIEIRLPPAPQSYRFDARYYWQDSHRAGYSGQFLVRKGEEWIGEKDGISYATIADYLACWWEPFHRAEGMVEAHFGCSFDTGVYGIFGRGRADNYRLANWWAKPD